MSDLAARFHERGIECRVERRDRLAILIPPDDSPLLAGGREALLKLAREEGFTHLAIELDPDGAALSRD